MDLALEIGHETIIETAKKCGISEKLYLDGLSAARGNLPPGSGVPPALVANTAIGQGQLLVTPLEMTRVLCAVANGGILPALSAVRGFVRGNISEDGLERLARGDSRRLMSKATSALISAMMIECVESGSGRQAKPSGGTAGGKTATAESGQYRAAAAGTEETDGGGDKVQIVHSWFCGFYPAEAPRWAITVILEGGATDSLIAAPVFARICEAFEE